MVNAKQKQFRPHELSQHVGAMFHMLPANDMRPVEIALRHAIELLQTVEPVALDLTAPDFGIPYALMFERSNHKEPVKAAASLLRMCLHATERGHTTENERVFIPLQLASLSDFVPDFQKRNSSNHPRPKRSEPDALDRGLDDALINNHGANWKELVVWLENEGVVTSWGISEPVTFTDGETLREVSLSTFHKRIKAAKTRRENP